MIDILITGANQGIGYATVQQLISDSSEEVRVYVGARSLAKATEAIEKINIPSGRSAQTELIPIEIDITKNETIEKAATQIPFLDILVNNAGIYVPDDFSNLDKLVEGMQNQFNTNLIGPIAVTTSFLPILEKSKNRPAIINVSTGLSSFVNMTNSASPQYGNTEMMYPASKTALNAYTVWLSKQRPDWRIVSFAPGHTATALNGFNGRQTVETAAKYLFDVIHDAKGPSGVLIQRAEVIGW
ncbi:3-oxoacyl-reductase [Meira miltonrushii]|uniref:3-oxoacyl-reductase n=1 Tax=Meira miltonrushii TaxID=1280837 RepID=A0A316VR49_9BASI|nr:3-oxoacyl-reductase [Meira miltonrushii]PWN37975.1 3-oxoacyl-reductase [Meira miltonrushii]